jgi:hypothetical protein
MDVHRFITGGFGVILSITLILSVFTSIGFRILIYLFLFLLILFFMYFIASRGIIIDLNKFKTAKDQNIILLELKVKKDSWPCVRNVIRERMISSPVSYYFIASSFPGQESSAKVLLYGEKSKVNVEKEVIKTALNAACNGFHLNLVNVELEENDMRLLEKIVSARSTRGKLWDLVYSSSSDLIMPQYYSYPVDQDPDNMVLQNGSGGKSVRIGYSISNREPLDVYLSIDDIMGRVGIFGSTGSGKSTTSALIVSKLPKTINPDEVKTVVIDWHSEYPRLLKKMNFFDYKVIDFETFPLELGFFCYKKMGVEGVSEILSEALSLTDPQSVTLSRLIDKHRPRNLRELVEVLENSINDGYWSREIRHAILRKLYVLYQSKYAKIFSSPCGNLDGFLIDTGKEPVIIFDMFKIKHATLRRLIAYAVISNIYYWVRESQSKVLLVMEEVQNLIGGLNSELVSSIIIEGRKFGLGVILVTQNPSIVPREVLANLNTKIVHAIKSGADKQVIANSMSLDEDYLRLLDKLDRGEAVIQSSIYRSPILVKIDLT